MLKHLLNCQVQIIQQLKINYLAGENNGVANNMPKGMVDFISFQNKRNNNVNF